jgi:FKBP-type peptidyl-prolyl cis-trans isomerase 2
MHKLFNPDSLAIKKEKNYGDYNSKHIQMAKLGRLSGYGLVNLNVFNGRQQQTGLRPYTG